MTITFGDVVIFIAGMLTIINLLERLGAFSRFIKSPLTNLKADIKVVDEKIAAMEKEIEALEKVDGDVAKSVNIISNDVRDLRVLIQGIELLDLIERHPNEETLIHNSYSAYKKLGGNGRIALAYGNYCAAKKIADIDIITQMT